jgi:hypothetical protein
MKKDIKKEKELANTLTNAISWRTEGIYHKKNEAFLDVIEKVDSLVIYDLKYIIYIYFIFLNNIKKLMIDFF